MESTVWQARGYVCACKLILKMIQIKKLSEENTELGKKFSQETGVMAQGLH